VSERVSVGTSGLRARERVARRRRDRRPASAGARLGHGRRPDEIVAGERLAIDGIPVGYSRGGRPGAVPRGELGVEIVPECTAADVPGPG
jgi:hypothetical protein